MSAFLCSDAHIFTIAKGLIGQEFTQRQPSNEGYTLGEKSESLGFKWLSTAEAIKLANLIGLRDRYKDLEFTEDDLQMVGASKSVEPLGMVKLIDCLVYQCDQFDSTDTSKDAEFVRFVSRELKSYQKGIINKLTDSFQWSID